MKIRYRIIKICVFVFVFCLPGCTDEELPVNHSFIGQGDYQGDYFPTNGWRYCSPEAVGMNTEKLKDARDFTATPEFLSDGLIVIKDGYIVCEDYFGNFTRDEYHTSYSVAKSFTSAIMGIAIDKGFVNGVDDKICTYFTQLNEPDVQDEKKEITVWNLLTMSAGIEWNESDYTDHENNDVYVMIDQADDYVDYVLAKDVIHAPGTVWSYSSGVSMLISGLIQEAVGVPAANFADEHLFAPIGIQEMNWETDNVGHTVGGWGINAPLYEFAKFAYLFLKKGNWNGTQIIPESWVNESVSPLNENVIRYGYQWWLTQGFTNADSDGIPDDAYFAWGLCGQYLIILPTENIVIVRMGHENPGEPVYSMKELIRLVMAAIN